MNVVLPEYGYLEVLSEKAFALVSAEPTKTTNSTSTSAMNEGDFHSGPAGYSANTPYIVTQYGSGFKEEPDWADGEH